MGKGQSKEKEKLEYMSQLKSQDWRVVHKEDPDAVDPLTYWAKNYGFSGKLSTSNIKELQQKMHEKCKGKRNKMGKEGYDQTQIWMKIAGQREEGERRAKKERESAKEREKEKQKEGEKEKQQEVEKEQQNEKTVREPVFFHRKEDDEYSGPYAEAREMLAQAAGIQPEPTQASAPELPPEEEDDHVDLPPKYTPAETPRPPKLRSKGPVGKWSKTLTSGFGNLLAPTSPGVVNMDNVETYPLIELPNPRAGQDGQLATMTVYRTWNQEDIKKAVEGIAHPREDVEECIVQMEGVRDSYHLNGYEVQQVWMCLLGPDWFYVKGAFVPVSADGNALPPGSQDLTQQVTPLLDRVRARYRRRANYTEIGRCKQRIDESFDEYRVRMEKIFKAHSGLEPDVDANGVPNENGPYRQQLKNALHGGSLTEISGWVNRHYIGMSGGTLADYINHALHAEKVIKSKKAQKSGGGQVFYQETEEEVFFQESRGRGRGQRGRGRGRGRGGFGLRTGSRVCWSCGKEGHLARDCRRNPNPPGPPPSQRTA